MKYYIKDAGVAWLVMRREHFFARRQVLCYFQDEAKPYWADYNRACEWKLPMLGYKTREEAQAVCDSMPLDEPTNAGQ